MPGGLLAFSGREHWAFFESSARAILALQDFPGRFILTTVQGMAKQCLRALALTLTWASDVAFEACGLAVRLNQAGSVSSKDGTWAVVANSCINSLSAYEPAGAPACLFTYFRVSA